MPYYQVHITEVVLVLEADDVDDARHQARDLMLDIATDCGSITVREY